MNTLIRNPRVRESLGNFVLVFLSVGIVVLYSSYQRPIWFDELMHYACGGWRNWPEVYQRILAPLYNGTADFSYPSSVFYSAATYPALQLFGANAFAFRYLSFLGGIFILFLGLVFLQKVGASFSWQLIFLFGAMGQFFAMNYIAEARPYALLGATSLAIATYYLFLSRGGVPRGIYVIGLIGCVIGSLNHVYFMLYLVLFALFFYGSAVSSRKEPLSWRSLLRFVNPIFFLLAIGIQLVLRLPHALQRPALQRDWFSFRDDAFFYTASEGGFLRVWADTSFQFLPMPSAVAPLVLFALISLFLLSGFARQRFPRILRGVAQPALFCLLLLGVSVAISAASLFGGYQILNRQWIASLLIMPVGFVWLVSTLGQNLRAVSRWGSRVLLVVVAAPVLLTGLYRAEMLWDSKRNADRALAQFVIDYPQISAENATPFLLGDPGAVPVANVNLAIGGEVWEAFRVEGRPYAHACTTGY